MQCESLICGSRLSHFHQQLTQKICTKINSKTVKSFCSGYPTKNIAPYFIKCKASLPTYYIKASNELEQLFHLKRNPDVTSSPKNDESTIYFYTQYN